MAFIGERGNWLRIREFKKTPDCHIKGSQTAKLIRRLRKYNKEHSFSWYDFSWMDTSMMKDKRWRIFWKDDFTAYAYGIFPDFGKTDEQMDKICEGLRDEAVGRFDGWDETAESQWIHWSRQPVGIVIVHHWTVD